MEIGTGIFLGCTFLGLVYLFTKTRETWNWKKILVCIAFAPIIIITLWLSYLYISDALQKRATVITSIKGISLNDKLNDVIFKHGKFTPKNRVSPSEADEEKYFLNNIRDKLIIVKNNRLVSITYFCNQNTDFTNLNGIQCGDEGEVVEKKFGNQLTVRCQTNIIDPIDNSRLDSPVKSLASSDLDSSVRGYETPSFGVRYILSHNKVVGFEIASTQRILSDARKFWRTCD